LSPTVVFLSAGFKSDMKTFEIQERTFEAPLDPRTGDGFEVKSVPRAYRVDFPTESSPAETLVALTSRSRHPLLVLDQQVASFHVSEDLLLRRVPHLLFDAIEENKSIASVLSVIDFLDRNRATKASMLFVVGGGITQDVAAFAASMYKRGMPWTFLPTTLLAQGDSGIGSKAALNHANAKNQLGLFSAPRHVVMHLGFLASLKDDHLLSGLGEIFRLHVTGGEAFLASFESEFPAAREGSEDSLRRLLVGALSVKRAVIEVDEFEVDLRRSLNYGHSFGHALEALVDYRIPHGVAVTIGMLVENEISFRRKLLPSDERDRIGRAARMLVPEASRNAFAAVDLSGLLDLLRLDKKTDGSVLKLVVPERVGRIRFIDFELNADSEAQLKDSVRAVADAL
jgi:3-dehydroquinate synthase